jgi:hypothetical protein
MTCPSCGTDNPENRTFCSRCGKPLQPSTVRPPDLEATVAELRAKLAATTSQLDALRTEHAELERERLRLFQQAATLLEERDQLRQQEALLRQAADEAAREADRLRGRIGELEERIRKLEHATSVVGGTKAGLGRLTAALVAIALLAGGGMGYLAGVRGGRSSEAARIAVLDQERTRLQSEVDASNQRESALREALDVAKRAESPAAAALAKREQAIAAREADLDRLNRELGERQAAVEAERGRLAKDRQALEASRRAASAPKTPPPAPPRPEAADDAVFLSWRATLQSTTPVSITIQAGKANFGSVTTAPMGGRPCQPAMRSRGVEKVAVRVEPGPKNGWAQAYFQVYPLAAAANRRPGDPGEPAVVEFYCRN